MWSSQLIFKHSLQCYTFCHTLYKCWGRQQTHTFSWCLLSVSIRTCSPNRETKMSSCWVYSTLHWPVSLWAKKNATWKLITHGQPPYILPQKCDFGSSLHMASLHKHCLKNATSEAIASLHKYCLKKHDLRSPLRMASLHNIASKNATSEAHYAWPAFTS